MKTNKIYTEIKITTNLKVIRIHSGKIKPEELELILDLNDIIWDITDEYHKPARKALKRIKEAVAEYNKEIDEI